MEIELIRYRYKPWGVDGRLLINGKPVCDTVEHPLQHKPAGVYTIDLDTQPFRHGNGPMMNLQGEITVGEYALPGLVLKSADTYDRLYSRIKKARQRGNPVHLNIYG